jgi:hypothetical protein
MPATGIDPKILPVKLFSPEFNDKLDRMKSPKAKASEIEHAIKHHITVNLEKDPEYYEKLSQRLESIIDRQYLCDHPGAGRYSGLLTERDGSESAEDRDQTQFA